MTLYGDITNDEREPLARDWRKRFVNGLHVPLEKGADLCQPFQLQGVNFGRSHGPGCRVGGGFCRRCETQRLDRHDIGDAHDGRRGNQNGCGSEQEASREHARNLARRTA